MQFSSVILALVASHLVAAADVANVFSNLSLKQTVDLTSTGALTPYNGWKATLDWALSSSTAAPGDKFTLTIPHSYRLTQNSLSLTASGTTYALCESTSGGSTSGTSTLTCTVQDAITSVPKVVGLVFFTLTLSSGGSGSASDVSDASFYKVGQNAINWSQTGDKALTTSITLTAGRTSPKSDMTYFSRTNPATSATQVYFAAQACPAGSIKSGSLSIKLTSGSFNCALAKTYLTNALNAWGLPQNAEESASLALQCTDTDVIVNYANLPAGFRPFISAERSNVDNVVFTENILCSNDASPKISAVLVTYVTAQGSGGSSGTAGVFVTGTTCWTGSETVTSTASNSGAGLTQSVIVQVPQLSSIVTSTWTGASTVTSTLPAVSGSCNVEVVVLVPSPVPSSSAPAPSSSAPEPSSSAPAPSSSAPAPSSSAPAPSSSAPAPSSSAPAPSSSAPAPSSSAPAPSSSAPEPSSSAPAPSSSAPAPSSSAPAPSSSTRPTVWITETEYVNDCSGSVVYTSIYATAV